MLSPLSPPPPITGSRNGVPSAPKYFAAKKEEFLSKNNTFCQGGVPLWRKKSAKQYLDTTIIDIIVLAFGPHDRPHQAQGHLPCCITKSSNWFHLLGTTAWMSDPYRWDWSRSWFASRTLMLFSPFFSISRLSSTYPFLPPQTELKGVKGMKR